ncbi:MAG: DUF177 domain-containing protein [Alphaproteobacteria bacterium]|nr:DUF177 domain-containing protein [Alphaproteobacteria bacterium]
MTEAHGFRRTVSVSKIGDAGVRQTVTARAEELPAIERYLELAAAKALKGEFVLERWRGKGVQVTGTVVADVVQTCVVTLDPVDAHVEASFERQFLPPEKLRAETEDQKEVVIDPAAPDPPEPLGHEIDLGEILIEELALNLDPYPRKPGVAFEGEAQGEQRPNPFAVLAKLKPKQP